MKRAVAFSQSRSRTLLFVSGAGYLPGAISGENISQHALCMRLMALGWQPVVVCPPGPPRPDAAPIPYPVIRVSDPVDAMAEMAVRLSPYATVVRGPWPAVRAVSWATAQRRRLHIHLSADSFGHAFPHPREAPTLRFSANAPFMRRIARALTGRPVALVPPVIEPEAYCCEPKGDAILFVNPVPEKGAHLVAAIAERMPHRRFLIAESWPDGGAVCHVRIRLPNVENAGAVADARLLYRQTRVVLMPSMWEETLGRIVAEAQISGIPAVASDRGGLHETVGRGGTIVPLGAPVEAWCRAIERLFTDAAHYRTASQGARARAARPDRDPAAATAQFLRFVGA